ncbi:MAG TPA: aminotransferase class V-fold PLP-dependent enzyme [Stellaceae bacterium]|nr:aminotransferase class V-fold PLP-dependent enzyme [Stellaceae bacterium]
MTPTLAPEDWPLDPAVTYLNHGGYGVCPRPVLAAQAEWRAQIERNPTGFMTRILPRALREAAAMIAATLGARGEDLVFIDNATTGCNAVLASLDLRAGDEILLTSLGYGAIAKAARHWAARAGARVVEAEIPVPLPDDDTLLRAVATRLGPRTRLAVFDHVASQSALLLPVAALTRLAHEAAVPVLIDGAHAPGLVPLAIAAIGADWYVGNCHKWLFAPRACAFLQAQASRQGTLHPLTISHGLGAGFTAEFDWTGTRDPSPFLAAPEGAAFHARLGGAALRARNDALAHEAAQFLARLWHTELGGPPASFAAMVTVRLPDRGAPSEARADALRLFLAERHRIEIAVVAFANALWVRLAAQIYNDIGDYEKLATAVGDWLRSSA